MARTMSPNNVFSGRIHSLTLGITGGASFEIDNLKSGTFTASDELKQETYEMEDGQEIVTTHGVKTTFEATISEILDTDDIGDYDVAKDADYLSVTTTGGGTGGAGLTFSMDLDEAYAQLDGMKTKFTGSKSGTTKQWTITDEGV